MDSKSHLVLEYRQVFTWTWVQSPAAEILAKREKEKKQVVTYRGWKWVFVVALYACWKTDHPEYGE